MSSFTPTQFDLFSPFSRVDGPVQTERLIIAPVTLNPSDGVVSFQWSTGQTSFQTSEIALHTVWHIEKDDKALAATDNVSYINNLPLTGWQNLILKLQVCFFNSLYYLYAYQYIFIIVFRIR